MRTIVPNRSFTGYPNGKRTRFAEGVEAEVSNEFAKSLEGKGDLVTTEPEPKNTGRKADTPNETGSAATAAPKSDPEPAASAD